MSFWVNITNLALVELLWDRSFSVPLLHTLHVVLYTYFIQANVAATALRTDKKNHCGHLYSPAFSFLPFLLFIMMVTAGERQDRQRTERGENMQQKASAGIKPELLLWGTALKHGTQLPGNPLGRPLFSLNEQDSYPHTIKEANT